MKCEDIMNVNLEWLSETDTIQRAAEVMAEAGVGFLPICDGHQRAIGVVTDRDLTVRALAKKVAPASTSAAMVMTSPAITCLATGDVGEAEELMAKERKSRLVITNAEGRLVGVLSVVDLIEKAPGRQALHAMRAVLRRDALGPRGGAAPGELLLKDDPVARALPPPSDDIKPRDRPTTGTHRARPDDLKEFPS
jgi:CBS domain-containing protein